MTDENNFHGIASIVCKKCGSQINVDICGRITPAFCQNVISGAMFTTECPRCGCKIMYDYDTMYDDAQNGIQIWVVHRHFKHSAERIARIKQVAEKLGDSTRIVLVPDMDALREQVSIISVGLDDRVVEICKSLAKFQLMDTRPDFHVQAVNFVSTGIEHYLQLVDESEESLFFVIESEWYDEVKRNYQSIFDQMKKENTIIDYTHEELTT